MMEVTYTEIALFIWALLASAGYVRQKAHASIAAKVLKQALEDRSKYDLLRKSWEEARAQR